MQKIKGKEAPGSFGQLATESSCTCHDVMIAKLVDRKCPDSIVHGGFTVG